MHIIIAPNAFKNSLQADKAAEAINEGFQESVLKCSTLLFPIADGGDGTAALLVKHLQGKWIDTIVQDPVGRKISSRYGLIDDGHTAVIELADASGLRLLTRDEYDPLHASTFGTGQLLLQAFNAGVSRMLVCIGGSATVDGGTGMLQALGVHFYNRSGESLSMPGFLDQLSGILLGETVKQLTAIEIIVLCDVENPLLGDSGAARVFGPQKGATAADIPLLEKRLSRLCEVTRDATGKDMATLVHGGAAGGIAAALHTYLGARLVNGIQYFLEVTQFSKQLTGADILITGEGSLDEQTLHGKGPFGVVKEAKRLHIRTVGMAGRISDHEKLIPWFDSLIDINDENDDPLTKLRNTFINLKRASTRLGNSLYRK